jgi:membrane protein implicated in regulation of membrane protease activity
VRLAAAGGSHVTWWSWIIAGAILLGAELAVVDAQFYLVLVGTAAIVVGLLAAGFPALGPAGQWAAFGVLAIVLMVGFRARIYRYLRGHPPEVATGPAGGTLTLPAPLAPGDSCQVEYRGSFWTARNDGSVPIPAGGHARVTRVHGLTLSVRLDA